MHAARPLSLFATVGLAACGGLDPRTLERLLPGMDRATVAVQLEREGCAIPVMRFFAADAAGREQEVVIDVYDGGDGGTSYALVSIDGGFAAATTATERDWFLAGQWWRDAGYMWGPEPVPTWSPQQLQALLRDALGPRRLPLDWTSLEAIDEAHHGKGRHTGDAMAVVLVFPLVIYLPYWAWVHTFGDDGSEAALAARAFLLAAPRATTAEQVIAALGSPASDRARDDGGVAARTLQYAHGRFTIHVGFRGGSLLWVDFGCWFDWAPAFIR